MTFLFPQHLVLGMEPKSSSLLHVDPSKIEASDFDCVLCCRTLYRPVVTPCGHTYCWVSIFYKRHLDVSSLTLDYLFFYSTGMLRSLYGLFDILPLMYGTAD
jgi:hypothetical protein